MRLPGREREMNRPQRRAVRRGETDILGYSSEPRSESTTM
jgi:hypothetical protein